MNKKGQLPFFPFLLDDEDEKDYEDDEEEEMEYEETESYWSLRNMIPLVFVAFIGYNLLWGFDLDFSLGESIMELRIWILIGMVIAILALSVKIVYQYQRGVKFTLGKYTGIMKPGLRLVIPLLQSYENIDIRQETIDLKPQDVMTKDQVNLKIDGVVFYAVKEPEKVVLNVENIVTQLEAKATSELKEIIGDKTMTDALQQRDTIAKALKTKLNKAIKDEDTSEEKRKDWGVDIRAVQINNIELPKQLVRAMAKEAEAEREKKAIKIRSEGEKEAAQNYLDASKKYGQTKNAMRLRELKTYEEIGKEQNTLMIVIPADMPAEMKAMTTALGHSEAVKQELKELKDKRN